MGSEAQKGRAWEAIITKPSRGDPFGTTLVNTGGAMAVCCHKSSTEGWKGDAANARLIAAAPDLLAVCREIAEHGTDDWEARMKTLRAAIARAEA